MGAQSGNTPSSSSGISTPGPAQSPTIPSYTGGGVSSGFGGMNGQSMSNAQPTGADTFAPPMQPFQNSFHGAMQQYRTSPFPLERQFFQPSNTGFVPPGVNPVYQQQQQQMSQQLQQTNADAEARAAAEQDWNNRNFYSWGGKQ